MSFFFLFFVFTTFHFLFFFFFLPVVLLPSSLPSDFVFYLSLSPLYLASPEITASPGVQVFCRKFYVSKRKLFKKTREKKTDEEWYQQQQPAGQ